MILGMEKDSIWTMGQVNQSPDLEDGWCLMHLVFNILMRNIHNERKDLLS